MRYCVYGAGKVGVAVIHDLIKNCEATSVDIFDPNSDNLVDAMERLEELLGDQMGCIGWIAGNAPDFHPTGYDVIISCAPYTANEHITKMALKFRTPMVDLGGNPGMVTIQEHLAFDNTTLIVPECGVSPGISNMFAAYMAKAGYTDIQVRCGGVPQFRGCNQFGYKFVFSLDGLISEYYGLVPFIRNGKLKLVEVRSQVEDWEGMRASPTSNNSPQVVKNLIKLGVQNYDYMTLRYPGHWSVWNKLEKQHDYDIDAIRRYLAARENMVYDRRFSSDKLILSVKGTRGKQLKATREERLEVLSDEKTLISAMEMTTAWGATIVAHYIATHRSELALQRKCGFMTPEMLVPEEWLIKELDERLVQ